MGKPVSIGQSHALSASKPSLLTYLDFVAMPAVSRFVAKDKFTTKNTPDGVQLHYLGENFKTNFLAKVEKNVAACTLRSHRLAADSLDKPILDELGDKARTTLAHIWELLKEQPNGEAGMLLTNGRANIFYVEDASGTLWAVRAFWSSGFGWRVGAYLVSSPGGWLADGAVFSR